MMLGRLVPQNDALHLKSLTTHFAIRRTVPDPNFKGQVQ